MLPKYSQEVQQQTESAKLAIFVLFLEYVRNVMHYFLKSSQKQKKNPTKNPQTCDNQGNWAAQQKHHSNILMIFCQLNTSDL